MTAFTNRLLHETSPYLKQHAHNPVDWYPWGNDALAKAKELDRPIFLSIGYSACHWCHVMEHESFEDADIAKILNEHFISIKVDREERPDLDQIYMTAVQLLTRQGGWPMSMFLTPDLKPFFGGTYFPPEDHYGRPGFKRVLLHLAEAWQQKRDAIEEQAGQLTGHIQQVMQLETTGGELTPNILQQAAGQLGRAFDSVHGGFGGAPKFPHAMELKLLLRVWKRFGDEGALEMAKKTLDHMAMGGMYDHLGGGFARYSTDERWLVPHFEKMLYDNALLTSAYVEAYQATKLPFYRQVVEETLDYIRREMTNPEGPFYSTQDADSEGVEGKFFVWTAQEVEQVLGPDDYKFFANLYDVSDEGNWEGHNILNRGRGDDIEARMMNMPVADLQRRARECRKKLFDVRSKRIWPGRDEKILTAWNGLMIDALAQAAQVFDKPDYAQAATKAADFILTKMRRPDGRLLRTYSSGSEPKLNAYLEDYTFLLNALVSLYEATFEVRWIQEALSLVKVLIEQFWDDAEGGFFYTGKDHEQLIARSKDPHDSSIPSGNSMAVTALLRLAKLTGRKELFEKAERTLRLFRGLLDSSPLAAGQMLIALDFYLGPVEEFALVGEEVKKALRVIHERFLPKKVLAVRPSSGFDAASEATLPLLAGKASSGPVTTYICRDFACQTPLVGTEALSKAIQEI